MTVPGSARGRVRFEVFEADLHTGELWRSGRKLPIPDQSFRVLAILLGRAGQLVTREELRASLWPTGSFVEYDQSLNAAVNRLRKTLRDSAEKPRFIETLPRRGYRFIGALQPEAPPGTQPVLDFTTPHLATGVDSAVEPEAAGAGGNARGTDATLRPTTRVGQFRLLWAVGALGAAALVAVLIFFSSAYGPRSPPSAREVVPFTSLPGQEVAPTFSPDGSHIAFAWNGETGDETEFDLYVKEIGSERLLRLTHHPAKALVPAWSPDGRSIAFVRMTDTDTSLFLVPALGGVEQRLISGRIAVGDLIQLSWSPDGKRVAYSGYGNTGAPEIYLVSLETLETQPLLPAPHCWEALQPAFSPDGTHLALICMSSPGAYGIYVLGLSDRSLRRLTSMVGIPRGIAWSTSGGQLVFSNDAGSGGELWQVSVDGRLTQLPFGEEGAAPAVSPRGSRLAYVRGRATTDIWRLDLTAARPEESVTKLIYSTRAQRNPRYSDDGAHIAFQSNRSGSPEIWLTEGDGSDPLRLTSFNGPLSDTPSWCSDGRRIAFDSSASAASAIYVEDIYERLPRKVTTSRNDLSRPAWSLDCRWLFANDRKPTLYRFPAAGGAAQPFSSQPAYYPIVLADRVIFGVMESTGVLLWSKPINGGTEQPIENMPRLSYADAWAANSTGVYYTNSADGQPAVNFYAFATRSTRRIMALKNRLVPGAGFGLSVSSDGRYLLFAQVDDVQSDIMLARDW